MSGCLRGRTPVPFQGPELLCQPGPALVQGAPGHLLAHVSAVYGAGVLHLQQLQAQVVRLVVVGVLQGTRCKLKLKHSSSERSLLCQADDETMPTLLGARA